MSKFSGAQGKGAAKRLREQRRKEAEFRFSESLHSSEGRRARHGELDPRRYQSRAGFVSRKVQDDPQHHEEVPLEPFDKKQNVKSVVCPRCGAGAGERCVSNTGKATNIPHAVRKQTALGLVDN